MTYHDPSCLWRCLFWVAVWTLILAVATAPWWAVACDYTPDQKTVPPKIETTAL